MGNHNSRVQGVLTMLRVVLLACLVAFSSASMGERRIASWEKFIAKTATKNLDRDDLLSEVNWFWNRHIRYLDDNKLNELALPLDKDFWQTPKQSLTRGFGDCEDFAIAKYFTLLRLGVASKHLRLIYVKHRQRTAHMILGYWADPDNEYEEVLVLDNLESRVKHLSRRSDLTPVYSFNADGLWFLKRDGRQYRHQFVPSAAEHSKWAGVLERVEQGL